MVFLIICLCFIFIMEFIPVLSEFLECINNWCFIILSVIALLWDNYFGKYNFWKRCTAMLLHVYVLWWDLDISNWVISCVFWCGYLTHLHWLNIWTSLLVRFWANLMVTDAQYWFQSVLRCSLVSNMVLVHIWHGIISALMNEHIAKLGYSRCSPLRS